MIALFRLRCGSLSWPTANVIKLPGGWSALTEYTFRANGQRQVRFPILILPIFLGSCAAGHIIENMPDANSADDLTEPNYRQIVAENIAIVFPNPAPLGTLEISGVRRTNHLKGPAWITCLKIHAENAPQEYAVFIQDGKIIDQRQGVLLDRCKQQTYQAYDTTIPAQFNQRR